VEAGFQNGVSKFIPKARPHRYAKRCGRGFKDSARGFNPGFSSYRESALKGRQISGSHVWLISVSVTTGSTAPLRRTFFCIETRG
jgi:hypothetical protein